MFLVLVSPDFTNRTSKQHSMAAKNRQGGITPCSESLACASKATKRVYSFSLAEEWLELVSPGTARPCQALQAAPLRRPSSVAAASEPAAKAPRCSETPTRTALRT